MGSSQLHRPQGFWDSALILQWPWSGVCSWLSPHLSNRANNTCLVYLMWLSWGSNEVMFRKPLKCRKALCSTMYYFWIRKQLFSCICKEGWNDVGPETPVPLSSWCQNNKPAGFPGGSMVKKLPASAEDTVPIWEDPCHGATKAVSHNYWAWVLEPGSHDWSPHALGPGHDERNHHKQKPASWS